MKKLYLSETDKKLCGVCGGIAEYFNIDSTLVRLGWVITWFMPIPSIVAYFVAAIIVPHNPGTE